MLGAGLILCDDCEEREYAERHPVLYLIFNRFQTHDGPFTGLSQMFSACLGASMQFGMYGRHRSEYVRTGDERELSRMLAHVGIDDEHDQ